MKKQTLSKNKEIILITVQILIIILSGILVQDEFYRIIISAAGIASLSYSLTHSIGKTDMRRTVLTEYELISRLERLRKKYERRT